MNTPKSAFKKISLIPDWINGHFIQWELDTFFKAARPYNFCLEISENLNFETILASKENLGEVFFAVDDFNLKQNWSPNYVYRVRLDTADNKRFYSNCLYFNTTSEPANKYAMASEINRKEILMSRYAGTMGWLLKRKSYASALDAKYSKNVDPVSGVPIADSKFEDYGTGLADGYFSPVPCSFYAEAGSQDKQLDPQGMGVKENITTNIRLPGYPLIDVRDIICSPEGSERYSIQAMNVKTLPGTCLPVLQKATILIIPVTDSIYSISLPIPLYT